MGDLDGTPAGFSSPAQQLALAVLEQALADLERRRAVPGPLALPESTACSRSLIESAESWFASDDTGWLFSFENVCTMVGIDAETVRRKLGIGQRGALRLHSHLDAGARVD